jgi:hypothetical protein
MFAEGTMKAVPPKESDMRKMIDEHEEVSEDLKVGARVALSVLLELANGEYISWSVRNGSPNSTLLMSVHWRRIKVSKKIKKNN